MNFQLQKTANERFNKYFSQGHRSKYNSVQVLIVYWNVNDNINFEKEALELLHLFRDEFNFDVTTYKIPNSGSYLNLDQEIFRFVIRLNNLPRTLGIIHYGGHGDDDRIAQRNRRNGLSVWASHAEGDLTPDNHLIWSDIQPKLGHADANILLLLDCCYAAQAARGSSDRVLPDNVELLAACGVGVETPGPKSPGSFTGALIREMRTALRDKQPVIVSDLSNALTRADAGLMQNPPYFALRGGRGSIRFEPLTQDVFPMRHASGASLSLQMMVDAAIMDDGIIDKIINWLQSDPPNEVTNINVIHIASQVKSIQDFVSVGRVEEESLAHISRLPETAQKEIQLAWRKFSTEIERAVRLFCQDFATLGSVHSNIEGFLQNLEGHLSTLQRIIECGLLSIPELFEDSNIREALKADKVEKLGVSQALKVRLAGIQQFSPELESNIPCIPAEDWCENLDEITNICIVRRPENSGTVLVEYKYFDGDSVPAKTAGINQLRRLESILKTASPSERYRTPHCLGCISEAYNDRLGIMYSIPSSTSTKTPITLYRILGLFAAQSKNAPNPPSLGQRFELAFQIGQALSRWHATGWLHQGIASYNIIFFPNERGEINYSEPYLCGFDYSREADASSARRREESSTIYDTYRHPDRQGSMPPKKHTKLHDIYSFGLLLVEICFWNRISNTFATPLRKGTLSLGDVVTDKIRGALCKMMGNKFETATIICLSSGCEVELDDRHLSRTTAAFNEKVLQRLEVGRQIDE